MEHLDCSWCGTRIRVTQEDREGFRIEIVTHDCESGHVRYTAWEEGY